MPSARVRLAGLVITAPTWRRAAWARLLPALAAMGVSLLASMLGVLQGIRHALEPDHLAAVSTLADERPGARGGFWLGASWGLGHTLSLLVVGGSLAAVGAQLPARWAAGFEVAVGVMLVALGTRAIVHAVREGRHGAHHFHAHGGRAHAHAAPAAHVHAGRWTLAARPLVIGLVHGLAGSGALSALVIAELPDTASRLVFIGVFGLGSVVGMAVLTALVGTPLARLRRAGAWASRLMMLVGAVSVTLGAWWAVTSARLLAG